LFVSETSHGVWTVRGDGNRRGGTFFTYEAAMRFIRTEFGADAQFIAAAAGSKKAA
jgi:hypothetical protein